MGAPPPEDAIPLDEQEAQGIGVPPPSPPLLPQGLASAQGGLDVSISASAGFVPPDAPDLPTQLAAGVSASFQPTTPGILAMCGFKIPGFDFSLSFLLLLPGFDFPPSFFFLFALSLKCDLANPLEASVAFGGGRSPSYVADLDAEFA
jgi:hypothetical protein